MIRLIILSLAFLCLITSAVNASSDCPLRNMVYQSGSYELRFDRSPDHPATVYPFKVTSRDNNVSFHGSIHYGNGYSTPNTVISTCSKSVLLEGANENRCSWGGTPYEINGTKTSFAFSADMDVKNPILFPVLHKSFYYARISWDREDRYDIDLPQDIWIFKDCEN